jgi:hypothetical protein
MSIYKIVITPYSQQVIQLLKKPVKRNRTKITDKTDKSTSIIHSYRNEILNV